MGTAPSSAGDFVRKIPDGDDRLRLVCNDCGYVQYENPKVVVGSVGTWQDKLLMCRRAINPRRGFWTLPAGFLELNETTAEGALREAWEEARARIELEGVLAVYTITRLSQVQVIYRARLISPEIAAGPESAEVALFDWPAIPWGEIAFPSVHWALNHYREAQERRSYEARANPPGQFGDG
ncbi:MAG: NUDIX domain-containing protein [Dongiaceae bacterium]